MIRDSVAMTVFRVFLVVVGGFVGTGARAAGEMLAPGRDGFPVGLVAINVVGAFVLGAVSAVASRAGVGRGMKDVLNVGIGVGVLGGFTSYSTMALAGTILFSRGAFVLAIAVSFALVSAGVLAAWAGHRLFSPRIKPAPEPASVPEGVAS
ncbi:camphor resistance protein CrcB [Frondihabitans australicus]|uniref:Fluoride-specific ion channel FluC n=1 Tax=Frondihabitans australicus TaxID=386892 RepID=A0A495IK56_9MICO|nr:camphor resistance protein CrcB [Frondihabitans australicus]